MKPGLIAAVMGTTLSLQAAAATGPSTSTAPYLIGNAPGVEFVSILSAGDQVQPAGQNGVYRMVGVPDGLGAFDNGDGSITVLMDHELPANSGAVRAHGGKGAFVSQWRIRKRDLKVLSGGDLIRSVKLWDAASQAYVDGDRVNFSRFCSADLAPPTAFFNHKTGKGLSDARLFMNGEEDDGPRRAMAHVAGGQEHGTGYELAKLGRHPFENLLANPFEQDKTIVAAPEDGSTNRVYFYIGEKQAGGNAVERAGLTNGRIYELRIEGYTSDDPETGFKSGAFSLVAKGGTSLARPEDGAWDTLDPGRFYFVTTASFSGNSRLWEVKFHDITQPERGGTVRVLLEGAPAGMKMMDNLSVDGEGNVYIQEDVGNNAHLGQVWAFNPHTAALTSLARHDPGRFLKGNANFLSQDEESSGILDVTDLFRGVEGYDTVHNHYFLLDVQTHHSLPGEIVEGGQLLLMKVAR